MYEYEPLDRERKQIRLLTLQPGSGDDKLFCTLATAYLDTPTSPYFETVSYVCGDSTVKATIMLHDSEVQIPTTSEAALRRMRRKNRLRTLWIDALCINQFDIEERGHQVGMMYEIYTQTSHNCIYLGLNDRNMQRISESMLAILREISIETRDYVDFETMLSEPLGHRTFSEQPFSIDIFQSGLLEFFQNPWFTRLWVVQEASLSCISTCYIGRHRLSLVAVLRIGKWLCYKWHQISQRDSAPIGGIRHAGFIFDAADRTHGCCYRGQSNLWFFLYTFAEFHTFDRRDQVYALVALWQIHTRTPVLPLILQPNYALSAHEVLINASKFAVQETNNLELLRDVCTNTAGRNWPSWIPVLDRNMGNYYQPQRLRLGRFKADDQIDLRLFSPIDESNTLDVAGVLIDEVTEVLEYVLVQWIRDALTHAPHDVKAALDRIDRISELRVVVGRIFSVAEDQRFSDQASDQTSDQEILLAYRDFKRYMGGHARSTESEEQETRDIRYGGELRHSLQGRHVFYTRDGHLGLGPEHTRRGDIVAVLYGCEWPVVMRPLPTPGEYKLLECAYVYGIMDGAAVHRHKELGREDDRFRII